MLLFFFLLRAVLKLGAVLGIGVALAGMTGAAAARGYRLLFGRALCYKRQHRWLFQNINEAFDVVSGTSLVILL